MMLEADVVLGKVTGQDTVQPIMAHPPANESDLSLENFLNAVIEKKGRKGIKLDFKSIEAFNGSKPILDKVRNNVRITITLLILHRCRIVPSLQLDSFFFPFFSSVDVPSVPERRYTGRADERNHDTCRREILRGPSEGVSGVHAVGRLDYQVREKKIKYTYT